jgi:transposase
MERVKSIVAEICETKQRQRIVPALATELEIQQALSHQGVSLTNESFRAMLRELELDQQIVTRRLLRSNGYEFKSEEK